MPLVRLTGLMLFVTAIFLALAAAATQTTSIKFKIRDEAPAPTGTANTGIDGATPAGASTGPRFRSVPIVWPLLVAGIAGLLMWFVPAPIANSPPAKRRRRRKRRTRK